MNGVHCRIGRTASGAPSGQRGSDREDMPRSNEDMPRSYEDMPRSYEGILLL